MNIGMTIVHSVILMNACWPNVVEPDLKDLKFFETFEVDVESSLFDQFVAS
jgi:hypothetical protein